MAKAKKFMIRRHPLDFMPERADVNPRPLDIEEVKKKAYPEV
jgi:hypothetical protein|tara:strand:- start:419 stop:544 length:126 start_codon:yes stop_codon:yes gene_type:complete